MIFAAFSPAASLLVILAIEHARARLFIDFTVPPPACHFYHYNVAYCYAPPFTLIAFTPIHLYFPPDIDGFARAAVLHTSHAAAGAAAKRAELRHT